MLKTNIRFINGKPMININGELHHPHAYTTYFDECGEWGDFISNGYKMFFVNISFTDLPINNTSGFSPFKTGVFESDTADYSEFENTVRGIISRCPDAFIFPRINISMPRKWIIKNPNETVITENGGARESLYSEKFMHDGAELLKELVIHIRSSDYSDRIAGYQLCGGTTQEWMHQDLYGSYSQMGMEKFRKWAMDKYAINNIKIPQREDLKNGPLTQEVRKYYEFCNQLPPKTIEHFSKVLKNAINDEQIVGVFYGYNAFVTDVLWGLHGLGEIIDSPYIDFFSSPCCYDDNRNLGLDWGDMLPVDSVKLHGKLCFIECDIRTHLTRRMQESRPGEYPEDILKTIDPNGNKTVWSGPDSLEFSTSAIRKAFAHQMIKASGIWWFDMWGGWYRDAEIMKELSEMKVISDNIKTKEADGFPSAEIVLFIDEKSYLNIPRGQPLLSAMNNIRVALGNTGIPFDTYMVEDAERVIHKYKAAIFTAPIPSDNGEKAIKLCQKLNTPYISPSEEKYIFSTTELRNTLTKIGIHCYNEGNHVFYCGNGIIGIHINNDEKNGNINLPKKYRVKPLLPEGKEYETDTITISASKHSTFIFELFNF